MNRRLRPRAKPFYVTVAVVYTLAVFTPFLIMLTAGRHNTSAGLGGAALTLLATFPWSLLARDQATFAAVPLLACLGNLGSLWLLLSEKAEHTSATSPPRVDRERVDSNA